MPETEPCHGHHPSAQTDTGETFTSRNPVTGEVVGTFALTGARADFSSMPGKAQMPNTTALAALEAAVDLLLQIGIENIRAHVGRYLDALEPELTDLGLSSCRARELARRSGIASFAAPADIDVIALHRAIDRRIVSCTTPDGLLRFSPHWPNALEEVPLVVAEIAAALERAR